MSSAPRRLCTFALDGLLYGIEVDRVVEVIRGPEFTRLPLAPPVVRGLVNLRGRIVSVIELRRCLGLEERATREAPVHIVVEHGGDAVSLLVDAVGDVMQVDLELEPPPDTLRGRARDFLEGAYPLAGRLLHVLDLDRTLDAAHA